MPIRDQLKAMLRRLAALVALSSLVVLTLPSAVANAAVSFQLVQAGFSEPIYVTHAGDSRLFVVEQRGLIKIVGGGIFLDLSALVSQSGFERGLLGLAFHPDYASNGRFYVNYTRASDGDTVIAEYRRSAGNPNAANPSSARTLLVIDQPAANHNGGWMAFKGANLYISSGDGGGSPGKRALDKTTLLGKILRINPLDPDGNGPKKYSIPPKNPYVGRSGRDEIFSRGLRNPWRCSHDRSSGKLWCADVGQSKYEEINRSKYGRGANYGWPKLEGRHYYPSGSLCTTNCKTRPIAVYAHGAFGGANCAVTGGYVSRRSGASLYGKYVFGDYCSGKLWVIPANFASGSALPAPVVDTGYLISSFGQGNDGKLYLVDHVGAVYRIVES